VILYDALHKYMGLNIEKEERYSSFGIRERKEELVAPPI
jgi:hypothetical protein